jgi:hypothetical protein
VIGFAEAGSGAAGDIAKVSQVFHPLGAVLGREFPVAFQIDVSLKLVAHRTRRFA